ncbi:hypothetical protein DAPPUDRAFT_320841 [Daphnia pulex]|uniref:Retrotransposon Copia-like N-terminal domain-containing protein n=1 Tax=Daphnia pulex TaxID=6669 RepID=E9GR80_DAPPU|nr:hypothetical protein DAPPUDRAFT_335494 [Daphnia pulex]EFX78040.1 hypothetical protein DAPPUDRAFT_320841 [Daphnia pulex]|eukprot:EFX63416.1 hypothetical protein DAPPUDRAFT_335494 [Daphnia pulex]
MAETRQDGRPSYTGVRFDGTNFDSWQFGVKLAIQSEELWRIVNGTHAVLPCEMPLSSATPRLRFLPVCSAGPQAIDRSIGTYL